MMNYGNIQLSILLPESQLQYSCRLISHNLIDNDPITTAELVAGDLICALIKPGCT